MLIASYVKGVVGDSEKGKNICNYEKITLILHGITKE